MFSFSSMDAFLFFNLKSCFELFELHMLSRNVLLTGKKLKLESDHKFCPGGGEKEK